MFYGGRQCSQWVLERSLQLGVAKTKFRLKKHSLLCKSKCLGGSTSPDYSPPTKYIHGRVAIVEPCQSNGVVAEQRTPRRRAKKGEPTCSDFMCIQVENSNTLYGIDFTRFVKSPTGQYSNKSYFFTKLFNIGASRVQHAARSDRTVYVRVRSIDLAGKANSRRQRPQRNQTVSFHAARAGTTVHANRQYP